MYLLHITCSPLNQRLNVIFQDSWSRDSDRDARNSSFLKSTAFGNAIDAASYSIPNAPSAPSSCSSHCIPRLHKMLPSYFMEEMSGSPSRTVDVGESDESKGLKGE